MSPWVLAVLWPAAGVAVGLLLPRGVRRRLAWSAPLAAGLAGLAVARSAGPGPLGAGSDPSVLALGRLEVGMLLVAGVAVAATLLLSGGIEGGEPLPIGIVGGAAVVALGATVPVVWAAALGVAVAALSLRWITAAPGRSTLASGRIAGAGAAALLGGAVLVPAARSAGGLVAVALPGSGPDPRAALTGALLAAGVAALLGLVPLGGWAAGASALLRGTELAPWALLLAPAALLGAGAVAAGIPAASRAAYADTLLVVGLASALAGGGFALRHARGRYGRLLLADLALAAAGVGSLHGEGRLGGLLILLTHLTCAPLLLNAARPGLERPRRLAWMALSGLPPAPAFWGRLLVLEGLAQVSGLALGCGLVAMAMLMGSAVRALVSPEPGAPGPRAGGAGRVLGWAVALAALALGFAPGFVAERILGVGFG